VDYRGQGLDELMKGLPLTHQRQYCETRLQIRIKQKNQKREQAQSFVLATKPTKHFFILLSLTLSPVEPNFANSKQI
jgi:hypothetical protein